MQPDSIRPAARIANFNFSDDMVSSVQSKFCQGLRIAAPTLRRRTLTILINRIIAEIGNNSRA